ncbi:spore coat protein YlbD [Oceanobacillus sp. Castelsardo]|uniref:spore coat protein YlbD n=1 Tax=Oceanobacillus sp. Castelsardo TaxID=1851204 RepID=UPI0008393272|nr:spore coat protein YlbD [Oceanobacillus sp. Castelsardo]
MEKEEHKLHPSVTSFKNFINEKPLLLREIRKNGRSWQDYYEKWVLLGEEDPYWQKYDKEDTDNGSNSKEPKDKSESKNFELINQIMKLTENIDINKIQGQVANLSKTIGAVQELVDQFQQSKKQQPQKSQPFNWFQD